MDFEEKKEYPSVLWIYLILFILFVVWVFFDSNNDMEEQNQTIEIELPYVDE